jgi:hypothetical protein
VVDDGVVYGAGDGQWACLGDSWGCGDHACQVGEEKKDGSVQASGVLARPGRRLGALTACAGMPWRGSGRAGAGQTCVSLSIGLVRSCSGEGREAMGHDERGRRGPGRSSACGVCMVHGMATMVIIALLLSVQMARLDAGEVQEW